MAVKKSEFYSSLWASCDSLRGGMDSSQYKDYILTPELVKNISKELHFHLHKFFFMAFFFLLYSYGMLHLCPV